ncbi:hypothetical protein G9A89_006012 [Geosiphon pyriformis]|nr:hypothetical protein G9A89_006012 [Geosiphon pyriformis]
MTSRNPRPRITQNWRLAMVVYQPIPNSYHQPAGLCSQNLGTATLISNIPPATVINDKLLAAIFPFELEKPSQLPLFNGATLEEKPITAIYTDAKVNEHPIKLILDSSSAGSIITKQLMDQLGHQVN